ncbi:hypothetical protein FSP39_006279 [Pinctada imbricata]|uniref:Fucosyltransferase n=1 Tax=Pinctada imbricata TaxID=66713 RepID=A0AA88XYN4_PINIB|nr:hypothetical protein FSP39_006279 [Pinctada imbricata]
MLTKADAVLFEVESIYHLPMKPKTGQVWVYVDMESPAYMPNGVAKWDNLFNWTMTYRRDSDIQTFYGSVWPKEQNNREKMEDFSKNKTQRMLWMVGHCETPGKREDYVKELQKFMGVDTVGRCGKRICGRNKPCENEMLRQYKYYFAAENSDCRDYITEKAFRTLQFPILPAARGGSNYSLYLPPKSYIDVNTFNKAESFAKYIKTMDENKDKYNDFFSWKNEYMGQYGVPDRLDPFCKLCERLHKQNKYRRLYRSIRDWLRGNAKTTGDYFCAEHQLAKL